ncbi:MAG TPA: hypothetical protein VL133_00935 [Devosia sp.]|nr:hypothetical protein [Devosia sp.]
MILWFSIQYFGIVGAAWTWTLRALVDSLLLFWATGMLRNLVRLFVPIALLVVAVTLATTNVLGLTGTLACTLVLLGVDLAWSIRNVPEPLRLLAGRIVAPLIRRIGFR